MVLVWPVKALTLTHQASFSGISCLIQPFTQWLGDTPPFKLFPLYWRSGEILYNILYNKQYKEMNRLGLRWRHVSLDICHFLSVSKQILQTQFCDAIRCLGQVSARHEVDWQQFKHLVRHVHGWRVCGCGHHATLNELRGCPLPSWLTGRSHRSTLSFHLFVPLAHCVLCLIFGIVLILHNKK